MNTRTSQFSVTQWLILINHYVMVVDSLSVIWIVENGSVSGRFDQVNERFDPDRAVIQAFDQLPVFAASLLK